MPETLSTHALTTVETAKEYLQLDLSDTRYDNLLTRQINAASGLIERYCGRHFEKAEYTDKLYGNGRKKILLGQYPIVEVIEVLVDDVPVTDYEVLAEEGMLYREMCWPWSGYLVGLASDPVGKRKNIQVRYKAGYVLPKDMTPEDPRTLPYDLEEVCIELVAVKFRKMVEEADGKKRKVHEEQNIDYERDIPPGIKSVLDLYRRIEV